MEWKTVKCSNVNDLEIQLNKLTAEGWQIWPQCIFSLTDSVDAITMSYFVIVCSREGSKEFNKILKD